MPKWLQITSLLLQSAPEEVSLVLQVASLLHGNHVAGGTTPVDPSAIVSMAVAQKQVKQ